MNDTKIEWCDSTWNPVTGCKHGCEYCYARRIAERFGNKEFNGNCIITDCNKDGICIKCDSYQPYEKLHVLDTPHYIFYPKKHIDPYPYGFEPTFHKYRLEEPQRKSKPRKIFVCSMADLFGEWVPDEWTDEVFQACQAAPQHKYLFLTKNPKRYLSLYDKKAFPYKENFWFGTTLTKPSDEYVWFEKTPYKTFVSFEPLLEGFGQLEKGVMPNWVIIGAQTGPGAAAPKAEWIASIVEQCKASNVPVFMKENLKPYIFLDL